MIYRNILTYLNNWSKKQNRKPLILRGARQVGKSFSVRQFAKNNKFELFEFNFEKNPEDADIFLKSKDPKEALKLIELKTTKTIEINNSLIFLDEIQEKPEIFAKLRYWYEDYPNLQIIAAGSLLDFALTDLEFSMPVGRIEYCFMGPLTFSEFLIAQGKENLVQEMDSFSFTNSWHPTIHIELLKELKNYWIVGGMPESVASYINTNSYLASEEIKQSILLTFKDDFSKYKNNLSSDLIRKVYLKSSILVGKRAKFVEYSREYNSSQIKSALELLTMAQVISKIKDTSGNGLPLGAEVNEKFNKYIFLDIGLMLTSSEIKIDKLSLNEDFAFINKGTLAEQFIGQQLLRLEPNYKEPSLYYWERTKRNSSAEIDYLDIFQNKVLPIEVKAGSSGKMKSLNLFLEERKLKTAVRFYSGFPEKHKLKNNEILYSLPLYFIENYKDKLI